MGSERGHATLWNVETNKFREAGREIHGVAVSPVNSDVLLPQRDGYFENWKPDFSAKIDGYLGKIFGFPRAIAFSPDGTFLASGGDQIVLRLWFRGDDPHARPLSGHTERIQAIAFHPRGDMIASGSFDGTVKLWGGLNSESIPRLSTPYFDNQLSADQMRLYGVTISADFRYIAVRTSATEVSVFDLATAAQVETIPVSTHATTGLNFLGAAPPVLFGIWQDETRIMKWDIAADKSVGSIPVAAAEKLFSDDPSVYFLLSADDRHLIQADHSNVTITDVSSGDTWFNLACKPSVNRDSPRIHVSPNGTIVDVSLGDHGSSTVDLETRQSWRREWPGALAVANHAKLIAYPVSTAILVMQPDSGREMCVLEHRAAALSDSRTLATATHDGHVFLWNVATGELITHFDPRAVITKLQFSADGRKLAGVSLDGAHRGPDGSEGVVRVFVWEGNDGP